MTSTIKADVIEAASGTNTSLELRGKGSGVVNLSTGSTIGGAALPTLSDVPDISSLQIGLMLNTFDDLVDHGRTLVSSPVVIADEFEDALGIDTGNSTGQYFVNGYVANGGTFVLSGTTTAQSGFDSPVARAFDGDLIKTNTECLFDTSNSVWFVTMDHGAGVTKTLQGAKLYGSSDLGLSATSSLTYRVHGSNSPIAAWNAGTIIGTKSVTDSAGIIVEWAAGDLTQTPYRYHAITLNNTGVNAGHYIAQIQFIDEAAAGAMDLRSVGVSMPSGPTSGFVVSKFSGADPTAVYASNDGGTTWDAVTLTDYGDYGSGTSVFAGPVTLTGGGTDVRLRATAASGTECKVEAWSGVFG